jgi:hypothetical protein
VSRNNQRGKNLVEPKLGGFLQHESFSQKAIQQPSQPADEKYLKAKGAQNIHDCSVGVFTSTKMADLSNIDFFLHKQSESVWMCASLSLFRSRCVRDEDVWRGKATICETSE